MNPHGPGRGLVVRRAAIAALLALLAAGSAGWPAAEARAGTALDPLTFLPSLHFDGLDGGDGGERFFPVQSSGVVPLESDGPDGPVLEPVRLFNSTQDANGDGRVDPEDSLENYIPFAIGPLLRGTGRTGLPDRGPNDQRPAAYFQRVELPRWPGWSVYQYWYYYAGNEWLNFHEHEWEAALVYVFGELPLRMRLSAHGAYPAHDWARLAELGRIEDATHPVLGVWWGSHAFAPPDVSLEDGVRLGWDGAVETRAGRLDAGDGERHPWVLLSNDAIAGDPSAAQVAAQPAATTVRPFAPLPDTYLFGDPFYGKAETADPRPAPWSSWDEPPGPYDSFFQDVPPSHANFAPVQALWQAGLLTGHVAPVDPPGSRYQLRSGDPLLRAQAVKLLVLALGIPAEEELLSPFSDLGPDDPNSLYPHEYVAAAAASGVVRGTAAGRFSPWRPVLRAQLVTLLVRALQKLRPGVLAPPPPGYAGALGSFDPVHGPAMRVAEFNGLLDGQPGFGSDWDPWAPAGRGEAANLVWAAMETS